METKVLQRLLLLALSLCTMYSIIVMIGSLSVYGDLRYILTINAWLLTVFLIGFAPALIVIVCGVVAVGWGFAQLFTWLVKGSFT